MKRRESPKTVRRYSDLLRMARTVKETTRSWMHLGHDGTIYLSNQRNGEDRTGYIKLSRREFETFIRFYETKQELRRR